MSSASSDESAVGAAAARAVAIAEAARAFASATADYPVLLQSVAERAASLVGGVSLLCPVDEREAGAPSCLVAGRAAHAAEVRAFLATKPGVVEGEVVAAALGAGAPVVVARGDEIALRLGPCTAELAARCGAASLLAASLRAGGRAVGALVVARCGPGSEPFAPSDVASAEDLVDHAAQAIANARLVASLRREAAEHRRRSEEAKTFVALVENSTDLIGMAGMDGQIRFVNAAGRRLLGLGGSDVSHLKVTDFLTDDGRAREDVVRDRGWQGESFLRHFETGELIPVRVSSFVARSSEGEPLCYATVQTDLRETKALERRLLHAQRMEAVGQLAGGVAHDFNNLLTIILSYASLATRVLPSDSEARDPLAQIDLAGHRAATLTRQLLAFSRKQVVDPKIVDLNEIVTDLERMVRRTLPDDIEIRMELGSNLGTIYADEGQIEQVILNLVVNARDAMPHGGTLTLTTANAPQAAPGSHESATVTLAVRDTGVGFSAATKARMFEPFFTTKPLGSGTGLGLATVVDIVERCGGRISAESEPGRGALFSISFPRAEGAVTVAPARRHSPGVGALSRGESILVVEDDSQVRELFTRVLRRDGYRVIDAPSPEAALTMSASTEVTLLVTDVILPQMSGRQLADRLSAERRGLRVLYVSGYGEQALGPHGVLGSGVDLLRKPVTPEMLLEGVRRVLDRATAA